MKQADLRGFGSTTILKIIIQSKEQRKKNYKEFHDKSLLAPIDRLVFGSGSMILIVLIRKMCNKMIKGKMKYIEQIFSVILSFHWFINPIPERSMSGISCFFRSSSLPCSRSEKSATTVTATWTTSIRKDLN